MSRSKLVCGDNMEVLKKIPDNSIDSIVTDPPYGLSFMGKKWDYDVPSVEFWKEVYRVLKPGGHILSFGGTRTYHRMVVNIEDAGFEIRDQIQWLYGSGFPKSLNVGKAVEREVVGSNPCERKNIPDRPIEGYNSLSGKEVNITKGQSEWEGWGSALKPANEPICLARKPLSEKTIAENVLKWRTGGLNINGCRVGLEDSGRFPANLILDETAAEMLDDQSGISKSSDNKCISNGSDQTHIWGYKKYNRDSVYSDKGGASRFFYVAKVSKAERNMGLDGFEEKEVIRQGLAGEKNNPTHSNLHPTIKPVKLMSYLCRLVTPKDGIILDPFMGSGSTGIAALLNDFRFYGIEFDSDYFKIAKARIENYKKYEKWYDRG